MVPFPLQLCWITKSHRYPGMLTPTQMVSVRRISRGPMRAIGKGTVGRVHANECSGSSMMLPELPRSLLGGGVYPGRSCR